MNASASAAWPALLDAAGLLESEIKIVRATLAMSRRGFAFAGRAGEADTKVVP
jgi:hypothetical protein